MRALMFPTLRLRMMAGTLVLTLVGAFTTGCMASIDRPPPPPRVMPPLEAVPPEPESGLARVLFETDVPARITRVSTGHVGSGLRARGASIEELLCERTPCAVTLPYGDHALSFTGLTEGGRRSTATIRVERATEIVNHTVGRQHANPGTIVGALVGITGAVILGVGLGLAKQQSDHHRPTSAAAANLALAGLGGIVGGGLLMGLFPGTHQEGSTTQWSTPVRAVGGSFGVRF
jgi:hypothetical protein